MDLTCSVKECPQNYFGLLMILLLIVTFIVCRLLWRRRALSKAKQNLQMEGFEDISCHMDTIK